MANDNQNLDDIGGGGGGGFLTASNGLTAVGTDVKFGGTLDSNTNVNLDGFDLGFTNGNVGVGIATPDASSILDVESTTKGSRPMPRVTTAQMNAISTPATNLVVFNTDLNSLMRYNGSAWISMASGYGLFSVNDSNGEPTFYATIYDAFSNCGANGVIKLHSNVTVTAVINLHTYADNITLDLNGYTVTHTSNAGSEFFCFYRDLGTGIRTFSVKNGKVISNGTGATTNSSVFYGINTLYLNDTVEIITTNNSALSSCASVYTPRVISSNGPAMVSCTVYGGYLEGISTYGSVYNAFIKLNSVAGSNGVYVGTSSHEVFGCTILDVNGAGSRTVYFRNGGKLRNTNVFIKTGACTGLDIGAGTTLTGIPDVDGCNVIHKGTGIAASFVYGRVKNSDFYAESNRALSMGANCANYNPAVENCTATTNSATHNAYSGIGAVIVRGLKTYNLNASNPNASFNITGTAGLNTVISDCQANVNNASAPNTNIALVATANYFLVNHEESLLGTGTNWNTQTNSQANTLDSYGNIKIG